MIPFPLELERIKAVIFDLDNTLVFKIFVSNSVALKQKIYWIS